MENCYLCGAFLCSENESKEHIFLNSIGGRLKSKRLLCKTCNSTFGHKSDRELSLQLAFLSSFLQVKRDSGETQIIKGGKTPDGQEYYLVEGSKPVPSKPTFEKKEENGEVKYSISARNEKELISILKGIRNKHPELDIEAEKQHFKWSEEYLDVPLTYNTTIGGDLAFRSIVKTAVNYYIYTQNETEQVKHLFDYLKGKLDLDICKHYHPTKPIYKRDSNEIIHLIHIVADKYSKQLYCFIEFFSAYSFIVILSNNYIGKSFKVTYGFDILKNIQVNKDVKLRLKKEELIGFDTINKIDYTVIVNKLDRIMKIATRIQNEKEISNITRKTVDKVFAKYKDEPLVTKQMTHELSNDLAEAYVKFAYRGMNKKK